LDKKLRLVVLYFLSEPCFPGRRRFAVIVVLLKLHRAVIFVDSGHHTPPPTSPPVPSCSW
jgi:hypothetical protein